MDKPSAAAMRAAAHSLDVTLGAGEASKANTRRVADIIDAEVAPLRRAAILAELNFKRSDVSGNFLGDDDHEAWSALSRALVEWGRKDG